MKIKILFAPTLIISTIILLIWFIYPAYTNGADPLKDPGIKEKREILQVETKKTEEIQKKSDNIKKLSDQLLSSDREQKILVEYIPETVKEEEIIDKLNFVAAGLGVSVFNLSVEQPKAPVRVAPVVEDASAPVGTEAVPLPAEESFTVTFSVIGNYDKTKELLQNVYNLKRFNEVSTLEIGIPKDATAESGVSGDNLQTNMSLTFNFLKKVERVSNPDGPVFSMSSFDMGPIREIESKKIIDVPSPLTAGESGRANPFRL